MEPTPLPPDPAAQALSLTPGRVAGIALLTLLATVFAYVLGQMLVFYNLPLALILTSLFVFGAAGLVFPTLWNLDVARFVGLGHVPWVFVGLAIAIGGANYAFANFLMGLAQNALPESWATDAKVLTRILAGAKGMTAWLVVIAAGLAAPVGEELFFRGWLQGLALQRFRTVASVIVLSAVFSAIHFDAIGFVARIELGLMFALMRLWSGSLWPAIAVHATHNTLSLGVMYLSEDPLADLDQPFPWLDVAPLAAASLVGTLLLLRVARQRAVSAPVETVPLDAAAPAMTLNVPAALRLAAPIVAVASLFMLLVVVAGPKLPGAGLLTLPAPTSPQVPQVPDLEDGSGHEE